MPSGGYRAAGGRPKGSLNKKTIARRALEAQKLQDASKVLVDEGIELPEGSKQTPLEYILGLMNNPRIDPMRRDRLAIAALPYTHERIDAALGGKRQRDGAAAEEAASGKFASPPPPKLVVNNE